MIELVSDVPGLPAGAGEQRALLARLRAVVEAKDAEVVMLRAELAAERELRRRMELRIAELERRLGQDSTNSGTPTSKESIGAKERRKAERTGRDWSERERRKDASGAGSPAIPGLALPGTRTPKNGRPRSRRRCARGAGPRWRARSPRGRRGRRSGT
jgi:Family of unknown function (DUF6444)